MTDDFLNYLYTHTHTLSHHPVPCFFLLYSAHLHQVIHPRWLEAAAPSSTLIPSALGYEKQTAGLAQTFRSPPLKPKRFLKTNKLLPELSTQGFLWGIEAALLLMPRSPPAPNFKIQIKDKVMCCISMGVFKPRFSQAEKGDCFIFRLSTGKFLSLFARAQLELITVFWHRKTIVPAAKLHFGISWLARSSFTLPFF